MTFKRQVTNIDFGTTSVENIFINDFMPMANGTFVKVYLVGYHYAMLNDTSINITNASLAKHLNIPLQDVLDAWDFWEKKSLIRKYEIQEDDATVYSVEFMSLRQLYIDNNYAVKTAQGKASVSSTYSSSPDDLSQAMQNPGISAMFQEIDYLIRRATSPNECKTILDWIYNYKMDPDMVVEAFKYAVNTRNVKSLKYVASIIRNWYDAGIFTPEALDQHVTESSQNYKNYRLVYKTLGYNRNAIAAGDKEIIDKWLETYKLSIDFIVRVLTESTKRTSNVNMNYMDRIVTNQHEKGIHTVEAFNEYIAQEQAKPKPQSKQGASINKAKSNKFHNFKGKLSSMSPEDLNKLLEKQSKKYD